jgi:predicted cupin superfamily sugar epimerase
MTIRPDLPNLDAEEITRLLELMPHPEGGWYRETWRDIPAEGGRGHGTAIYFLLPGDVENRWHRVDAVEIWHHLAGAPLDLEIGKDSPTAETTIHLGTDLRAGERPQGIVPAHHWQRAKSRGEWTLVSCTVSPAFQFEGFELRPTAGGLRPRAGDQESR